METPLKKKNIFTVYPQQAVDYKAKVKASLATKYIGFAEGIEGSSTELYRIQVEKYANTDDYTDNDIIFVSIGGKRGCLEIRKVQQDRTIKEALKAIELGAILITDSVGYIHYNSRTKQQFPTTITVEEFANEIGLYNIGEKRLQNTLIAKNYNYTEQTINGHTLGIWNKMQLNIIKT